MPILNLGNDDFESASTNMLEMLQQQRSDLLGSTIDVHVGIGLLAGAEADRLAQKYGANDARVQLLRDRSAAAAARVDALTVEQEIALVRTPPPPTTGALIQGRVTDMTQRTAGQVIVQLIDEKGQPVAGIEPVTTDDSGYFAFELTPDMVKAAQSKLSVLVRAADIRLVPAVVEPVAVTPGATLMMDVSLSAAELERLRLRLPIAPDKTTVKVQAARATTAEESAADASDATTAAAKSEDQAGPTNAAADEVASGKTAADKAKAKDKPARKPRSPRKR
ncbi:hypothetical protein [Bradyrhizobium iriomotense]|uniref:Carboxypeptidase regulatory-like domain-containing protein n=1 Tax=Bradyrhizobium iriomotense TaxID=441950 RepID=A0ABQ6B2D2_9BRAD|nr:hypothetical protein [Bradyrhizobium iriomotense]GLR87963.1 hypothetical protein GCM10007857_46750 [Bradyrhizobium iriomotense]